MASFNNSVGLSPPDRQRLWLSLGLERVQFFYGERYAGNWLEAGKFSEGLFRRTPSNGLSLESITASQEPHLVLVSTDPKIPSFDSRVSGELWTALMPHPLSHVNSLPADFLCRPNEFSDSLKKLFHLLGQFESSAHTREFVGIELSGSSYSAALVLQYVQKRLINVELGDSLPTICRELARQHGVDESRFSMRGLHYRWVVTPANTLDALAETIRRTVDSGEERPLDRPADSTVDISVL